MSKIFHCFRHRKAARIVCSFRQPAHLEDDKADVGELTENARKIIDIAVDAERAGMEPTDWTIFFGPGGGLEMVAGSEMPLDSLAWSRGARMAWQVTHTSGGIRVDGRELAERCRLVAESAPRTVRTLVASGRLYELIPAV